MEIEIEERFNRIYALLKEIEAREGRNESKSIPLEAEQEGLTLRFDNDKNIR